MIGFSRGDVVLVGFVFSDESGRKLRPALIVSGSAYHRGRQEMVVMAITSNIGRRLFGIEYEGHRLTEFEGIQAAKRFLETLG